MSITKWQPLELLNETWHDLSHMAGVHDLATDVYEDNGNVIVEMHTPGIDIKHITIEVHDNFLRVAGHREEKKEINKKNFYRKEIHYGDFERVITLPADVKEDEARAESSNGLLTITLPKRTVKNGKKIMITQK